MNTNRHIMVVENDPDEQAMVAQILSYQNISIDVVDDFERARELMFYYQVPYDAVIIDLTLPSANGWELVSEIRTNPSTATLPCIAVTARHTPKLHDDALKAGFTAYFTKPINTNAFMNEMWSLL